MIYTASTRHENVGPFHRRISFGGLKLRGDFQPSFYRAKIEVGLSEIGDCKFQSRLLFHLFLSSTSLVPFNFYPSSNFKTSHLLIWLR